MSDPDALNLTATPSDGVKRRLSEQAQSRTPLEQRDEWQTPPHVFAWAVERWGPFEIDLAATAANALCDRFLTREDNALAHDWHALALRGWCNPPYSNVRPWIERAADEARHGFASTWLIPAFRGDVYHAELTQRCARDIVLISPRLSFIAPNGGPKPGNVGGSMFVRFDAYPPADRRARITIETIRSPTKPTRKGKR